MRTNVNLAPDARELAELYAHANGITLGDAISHLIRKSQRVVSPQAVPVEIDLGPTGFPIFPPQGRILTTEMVLKAQQEEDIV